jgi:hypothetical protein
MVSFLPYYYVSTIVIAHQLLLLVVNHAVIGNAFSPNSNRNRAISFLSSAARTTDTIEFQSDDSQFGRGEFHLSALIEEGDVVVYQTGSWLVDGVVVGDGSPPAFSFAKIDNVQLVWTHNCEHGVLRGVKIAVFEDDETIVRVLEPLIHVEFGPEQLVARLPVSWHELSDEGILKVPVKPSDWDYLMITEE